MNVNFTVRLRGETAQLVNELVKDGYSESKTEAVRTALILYGLQLGILSRKSLHSKALGLIKASGKEYSDEQIRKQIESVR